MFDANLQKANGYLRLVRAAHNVFGWEWVILDCPICGEEHCHGGSANWGLSSPIASLGRRDSPCFPIELRPDEGYELVYAGTLPIYDAMGDGEPDMTVGWREDLAAHIQAYEAKVNQFVKLKTPWVKVFGNEGACHELGG